jgi:hypothetical protein
MNLFLRFLIFAVAEALGYFMIVYVERIVRIFGKMFWLEDYLGPGWTYNVWRLLGLIVMFLGALILFDKFSLF